MKHIKKKYLFAEKNITVRSNNINSSVKKVDRRDKKTLKNNKNDIAFVKTTEDLFIKGFIHNYNGNYTVVPMPDLTLVYFDHAYYMNKVRKEKEKELFQKLNSEEEVAEEATNEIYHYYGHASNCIISLFTAMESFINHLIPDSENFKRQLKNRTEIYSKEQIQEHINFNDKLKIVLPYFFEGKNFFKKSTPVNQVLSSLKELRDDIIHTKSEKNFEKQEKLFERVLKFKYDKAIEAVGTFMNFYIPDYLVECDCGVDY